MLNIVILTSTAPDLSIVTNASHVFRRVRHKLSGIYMYEVVKNRSGRYGPGWIFNNTQLAQYIHDITLEYVNGLND